MGESRIFMYAHVLQYDAVLHRSAFFDVNVSSEHRVFYLPFYDTAVGDQRIGRAAAFNVQRRRFVFYLREYRTFGGSEEVVAYVDIEHIHIALKVRRHRIYA